MKLVTVVSVGTHIGGATSGVHASPEICESTHYVFDIYHTIGKIILAEKFIASATRFLNCM